MLYGYARVSSKDQREDRQIIELKKEGVQDKQIYVDKESGKDFERTKYKRLMRALKCGDVLIVKSIDRLGRNYSEILEEWRKLTKKKHVHIKILDMPLLDTTNYKDLTGKLITDIVLQLLSYVAESERVNIRQRQQEGIAAAKMRGVRFGRPALEIDDCEFERCINLWKTRQKTARDVMKMLGVSKSTFYRMVSDLEWLP